jgi:hypothetical protein
VVKRAVVTALVVASNALLSGQPSNQVLVPPESWLDRPLVNWNTPDRSIPAAVTNREAVAEITKRCASLQVRRSTQGERAVSEAGWLPFLMFDRQIMARDVEIIGGLAAADGMCRPVDFNVFVFAAGQFAGTLSPDRMASRSDSSVGGAIRLADDVISAEFARYASADALCCPSGRVTVRYRIDRRGPFPLVVPASVQPTRR